MSKTFDFKLKASDLTRKKDPYAVGCLTCQYRDQDCRNKNSTCYRCVHEEYEGFYKYWEVHDDLISTFNHN